MISAIIVEPDNLVRREIRQVLQGSLPDLACEDIDYTQLFSAPNGHTRHDVMLLAVPNSFDKTVEILKATLRSYTPTYILLLSETGVLDYSLRDLPVAPAGHLSKRCPPAILTSAISLVLAGGQCFPPPTTADWRGRTSAESSDSPKNHPRRRWYDQVSPSTTQQNSLATHPASPPQKPDTPTPPIEPAGHQPQQANHAGNDCELLGLTRRQYEILVLLAKGYPIKSISRALNISSSTVKTHTDALYQRLSVHNRNAAVFEAISRGAHLGLEKPRAKQ